MSSPRPPGGDQDAVDALMQRLADERGPYYDLASVVAWLGVTGPDIAKRVAAGELLAVPLRDGAQVFPIWQFTPVGKPLPGLPALLGTLRPAVGDPWTIAFWLTEPAEELGGSTPIARLPDQPDAVLQLARRYAAGWR